MVSINKGLVLHMPLDLESYNSSTKRFTDKSAQGNHGLSANAGISFGADRMGQSNRSAAFNGTSDYIDCGNDSSLDITDEITLCAWIKIVSNGKITSKGDFTALTGYVLDVDSSNRIKMVIGDGVDMKSSYSVNGYADGEFHHVLGKWGGSDIDVFVDGIEVAYQSHTSMTTLAVSGQDLNISRYYGGNYLQSNLADLRIYNRALSLPEIQLLYTSYRPKAVI